MPSDVEAFLRTLNTSDRARAAAWDAVYTISDDAKAQALLQQLPFSDDVRARLWDARRGQGMEPMPTPAAPQAPMRQGARTARGMMLEKAVDWLPAVGGAVGGIAGGIGGTVAGMGVGGAPGAVGGAALGGAAGESARQLLNRALDKPAPASRAEAATGIATEAVKQGAAEVAGVGIGAGMAKAGPWLMQTALKPAQAVLKEYNTTAPRLVKTLLDEGVSVTQSGLEKLQRLFAATNDEIRDAIAGATGSVDKSRVAARVLPTAAKQAQQTNAAKALQDVGDEVTAFVDHPVYSGSKLSVPEAQAMKVGTYREIGKKYGQQSNASTETQKALARGLKEEIVAEVPEIAELNARDSGLMAAMDAVGRRVAQSGNKDPIGFAWVTQHPMTFLAALMDRNPAVKSLLARGLYNKAAGVAQVSPQAIRVAVQAVASSGQREPGDAPPPE